MNTHLTKDKERSRVGLASTPYALHPSPPWDHADYGVLTMLALIEYAEKDEDLAGMLLYYGKERQDIMRNKGKVDPVRISRFYTLGSAQLLLPKGKEDAIRRADWFFERILDGELLSVNGEELGLLSEWVLRKEKEEPKVFVIGNFAGVIPPLGWGDLQRKKKKKVSLILEQVAARRAGPILGTYSAVATLGVLEHALRRVGGDARKLEPEVAEWFFGERGIASYTANKSTLKSISRELGGLGVVSSIDDEAGAPIVLAISPGVSSIYQEANWDITPTTS